MIVLYIILGVIALPFIIALFISTKMDYEKTVLIEKPVDVVWGKVNSMQKFDVWNPWAERDLNMEKTYGGDEGTVGSYHHWRSDVKGVGEGRQTITKVEDNKLLESKLEFIKPFKSFADGYFKLEDANGKTNFTWGFKSKMKYPMNLMKLFMNFEKAMNKDFTKGLNNLKGMCEA